MEKINVCFPTLNRYDLLKQSIKALYDGLIMPTDIWVIDNGGGFMQEDRLEFEDDHGIRHHYWKPGHNLGCAGSWNKFIQMTEGVLIISNDDILPHDDTLLTLLNAYDPQAVTCPESIIGGNAFSFFLLPRPIVASVGQFDESISPNYCWFEDNDLFRRLMLAGYQLKGIQGCQVEHGVSSTMKSYSPDELEQHHQKFRLAQANFISKWGGLPHQETFKTPYGTDNE